MGSPGRISRGSCVTSTGRAGLAGCKRVLACRSKKKVPITPESLNNLVEKFAQPGASLADVHTDINCLLGFAYFLRYSKLVSLGGRYFHISVELFLELSKTDQHRELSSFDRS